MPIDVRWRDDKRRVILVQMSGTWTLNEFYEIDTRSIALEDTVNHKVCFLVDMRGTNFVPKGMSLDRTRKVLQSHHPNTDITVIVGVSTLPRIMLDTFLKAGRVSTQYMLCATIEEADEVLARRLAELDAMRTDTT